MCEVDIEARRARDLERYHRRTAERRAQRLCLKCGKRPPAPHRSQCGACAAKKRPADRARHRRRTAARVAAGMCPKCGKRPPEPGRSLCGDCAERTNRASRARDARLRAAGIPRRDREHALAYERERARRLAEARRAAGLCSACGKVPAEDGRALCGGCGEKRRARERARYARASSEGKLYGGGWRPAGASAASEAASATRRGAPPACAPRAASGLPSRGARPASRAGWRGGSPSAGPTPPGAPPGSASSAQGR